MFSLGIIAGLVAMLCWGVADFIQALLVRKLGSPKVMFFSNVIGLILTFIFVFAYINRGGTFQLSMFIITWIVVSGLIEALAAYFFMKSFEEGEVSIVAPISAAYFFITAILSFLFLSETMSVTKILAIFAILGGITLVSTDLSKIHHVTSVKGVKEALLAMLFWGIYFFMLGILKKDLLGGNGTLEWRTHTAIIIFLLTGISNGVFMIILSLLKKGITTAGDLSGKLVLPAFFANMVFYTVAWLSVNYGLIFEEVSVVTSVSSLYPAITVLLAGIVLKEKLVTNQKIGLFFLFAGIVLISI
ncbi:MAG: DMT family transporter [Nanoarchaeota archaeon]|nr:DMT family transporter [Nanoarchaeota archaeon]